MADIQYIKYQMPFDEAKVNGKQFRVNILGFIPSGTPPEPILLKAGENPLETEEEDSDDFFAPIRSQSGNISICTRMPDGSLLDLADILPTNNLSNPIQVQELVNGAWQNIWLGYLSCEVYNQAYTEVPENISLPIVSILGAMKSKSITTNNTIKSIGDLLGDLFVMPGHPYIFYTPEDYAIFEKLINTSIFVETEEYQNEDNTMYQLEGKSLYEVLSTLCKFMGWTAREQNGNIYLEVLQGNGQISGTVTRNIADLEWKGDGHQRSVRQGRKIGIVVAKLKKFDIKTELGDMPLGSFNFDIDQLFDQYYIWLYASINTTAYSNMKLHFAKGEITMGEEYYSGSYSFHQVTGAGDDSSVSIMIQHSVPYANKNSDAYEAFFQPYLSHEIYAGTCFARMEADAINQHDPAHKNYKDGILLSFFPGAFGLYGGTPIFEMRTVQNFASFEDGYLNISTSLSVFSAGASYGVQGTSTYIVLSLQVGNKYWDGDGTHGSPSWIGESYPVKFRVALNYTSTQLVGNWKSSMGIPKTDGYLVPISKQIMGPVTLCIYPETYIDNMDSRSRAGFVCNMFFDKLSIGYVMKPNPRLSNRGENNYRRNINSSFSDEVSIKTDLASFNTNMPSLSLLYEPGGDTPVKTLPYLNADGQTYSYRRPEIDLLNRLQLFYSKPRTILTLEVEHIDDVPLPLLRLNGINDGKVYAPLSESRDYRNNISKLTCIEIPQ